MNDEPDEVLTTDNNESDDFDPDNPESYQDIDQMMEDVTGDVPQSGKSYSIADEVKQDEGDR